MSISARDRRMMSLATRVAEDSDCNDKHGAVVTVGSRILAIAVNRQEPERAVPGGHAEVRALKRAAPEVFHGGWDWDQEWVTVYSARAHALPISKPCELCQEEMKKTGIVKRVVFHDGWNIQELK